MGTNHEPLADPEELATSHLLTGQWLSTDDLANLLGVDASSVRRWRTSEPPQGPAFVRLSARHVIYSSGDVEAWLRSRRIEPGCIA